MPCSHYGWHYILVLTIIMILKNAIMLTSKAPSSFFRALLKNDTPKINIYLCNYKVHLNNKKITLLQSNVRSGLTL